MTDPKGIDYREFMPEQKAELHTFYRGLLDQGDRVIELHDWLHDRESSALRARTFIARVAGSIVGALTAVPHILTLEGTEIKGAWQQNSIVAPSMRGRGVGKALIEAAADGWDVLLAKGTSAAMYRLRKAVGFQDVQNSNYLAQVLAPSTVHGNLGRRAAGLGQYMASYPRRRRLLRASGEGLVCEHAHSNHERFDVLSESLRGCPEVRSHKDGHYLKWRYSDCPGREYVIFVAKDKRGVRAALVLRDAPMPGEAAWVVDLVTDCRDGPSIQALLKLAVLGAVSSKAGSIKAFATSSRVRNVFRSAGFSELRSTPHFTFRAHDREIAAALKQADWDFYHGDGDVELY